MTKTFAAEILGDFVSLFFPHYCVSCHNALVKGEDFICTKCILDLPRSNYHLDRENPFFVKLSGRLSVLYVMSFFKFVKGGKVQRVLHSLKYKNKPEFGRMLGRVYGNELMNNGFKDKFDLIVPIPLHRSRFKQRGYNQSEEFGIGLAEVLQIPCRDEFLVRTTQTETQTRRSKLKRWQNVKSVFEVTQAEAISGKRILLIDDVVTTGATLEAAGQALIKANCKELSIACIAATQ
ncbi:ComF family protein [Chryseosolibacter indicus]|uniref:ComF family protein n=1 Tax=Chryseosolibacter indicus TaxID=2782351 RepID=A0ABS5VNU4_9BACT|nr:phosphoribosyltransferase family protein [Chryseosolibacter indicus]MBT1703112.1 ComF family protein [Chryseosolibacter indicus]